MNDVKNEKQLISIKKIIFYTVGMGITFMIIALLTGVFTVGTDGARFGAAVIAGN